MESSTKQQQQQQKWMREREKGVHDQWMKIDYEIMLDFFSGWNSYEMFV